MNSQAIFIISNEHCFFGRALLEGIFNDVNGHCEHTLNTLLNIEIGPISLIDYIAKRVF